MIVLAGFAVAWMNFSGAATSEGAANADGSESGSQTVTQFAGFPIGNSHTISFSAPARGNYRLKLLVEKARRGSVARVELDKQQIRDNVALGDIASASRELPLGTHELSQGEHEFNVEVTNPGEASSEQLQFALEHVPE